jgi:hypothetical protein
VVVMTEAAGGNINRPFQVAKPTLVKALLLSSQSSFT